MKLEDPNRGSTADLFADALREYRSGRPAAAESLCRLVTQRESDHAAALHLLGLLANQSGRTDEGAVLLRRSVELAPAVADFRSNLAGVLGSLGRHGEALEHLREAVRLVPTLSHGHNNLGVALEALGRYAEADAALREAVRLDPRYAAAWHHLGNVLHRAGKLDESVAAPRRAIALRPDYAHAHNNLGAALQDLGRTDEAVACYREAARLDPSLAVPLSNILVSHRYVERDPAEVFREHVAWAQRHAAPLYATIKPHENDRDPGRRLRVGYVSPDFKAHPVARFIEPLLAGHDRAAVEVFCYADVRAREQDAVTRRLQGVADAWRDISDLSEQDSAELIRADRIDVLVDLAGQTDGRQRQMLLFARQPAPVQVAYLGYSETTGLKTVGYRLTDAVCDPSELGTDAYYTEQLVRLDGCAWCYRPFDPSPPVNEPPALTAGHVTFAVFNRLAKASPAAVAAWAVVLARLPGSRLLAACPPGGEAHARELLKAGGLDLSRLDLVPRSQSADGYLRLYHRADVALDTFPHNGHTTTCDAAWMGVPTVTLAGRTFIARLAASVLAPLGLGDLVAATPAQYVEVASALACDLPGLAALRGGLRERFARSPLADGPGLARRVEDAYRAMWRRWCEGGAAAAPQPSTI